MHRPIETNGSKSTTVGGGQTEIFHRDKLDYLQQHLYDFKSALGRGVVERGTNAVILDDYYLIDRLLQPDVIDYLHALLRGTPWYMKVGTVQHRTSLLRRPPTAGSGPTTTGVELGQDVEEINLDRTFQDFGATYEFLCAMIQEMAERCGIESPLVGNYISADGALALTLASGGVPRDYLNIFVAGVEQARAAMALKWLTPKYVYKGASSLSYRNATDNNLEVFRTEAGGDASGLERLYTDLLNFCLLEKRKTGFLLSQEARKTHVREHDLILQLVDFKLIHVVEPDTSAASGRPGRFEAYTLDFAIFMEPRIRNIEHMEFWRKDEQRRKRGVREAPVYDLTRAHSVVISDAPSPSVEEVIGSIELQVGTDEVTDVMSSD